MEKEKEIVCMETVDRPGTPCCCCHERIPFVNYLQYFIQKQNPKNEKWTFVSRAELQKKFGSDPNCPPEINNSELKYLVYCTRSCIKEIINYLNSFGTERYRYNTKYHIIRSKIDCGDDYE